MYGEGGQYCHFQHQSKRLVCKLSTYGDNIFGDEYHKGC